MIRTTVRHDVTPCWIGQRTGNPEHGIQHTVYIVRDAQGAPLYIGRTSNVAQRAKAHRTRAKNTWWPLMADVELILTCCINSASPLELSLIRELQPRFNADPRNSSAKGWATRRRYREPVSS